MLWADEMVIASKERVRKRKMVRRDRVLIVDDAINFQFGRQAVIDWLPERQRAGVIIWWKRKGLGVGI